MNDQIERLAGIAKLADALTDFLSGEGWSIAYAIEKVAQGAWTLDEAHEFIGD